MNWNIVRENAYHRVNKIGYVLTVTLILSSLPVASAQYAPDGFNLDTIRHDTVVGGVYVDGGHGVRTSPHTEVFEDGVYVWRDLCFDLDSRDVTEYIRPQNNMAYDRKIGGYLQPVGTVLVAEHNEKVPVPSSGSTESPSESIPGFGSLLVILTILASIIVARRLS